MIVCVSKTPVVITAADIEKAKIVRLCEKPLTELAYLDIRVSGCSSLPILALAPVDKSREVSLQKSMLRWKSQPGGVNVPHADLKVHTSAVGDRVDVQGIGITW